MLRMILLLVGALSMSAVSHAQTPDGEWTLAIHGGAGVMERDRITPEQDAEIRAALNRALDAGSAVLAEGGSAMDAVEAAVVVLEDDPHFNAGRGSVFTYDGVNEMDASIMDGTDLSAGAVTGVTRTKNPVKLARKVIAETPHVFLSREGADTFSREQGLEQVDPSYFATPERRRQLDELKARQVGYFDVDLKYGTVGAVAQDKDGNVAAATSTGGLTGKRWGRIGDSPIIGAGTYADNGACAISATGAGEYFIRLGVAHEICSRMRYRFREELNEAQAGVPTDDEGNPQYYVHASEFPLPAEAAQEVVDSVIADLGTLGGTGGVIYATPWGQSGFSFNTPGMYRGRADSSGAKRVAIYGDEE